MCVCVSVYSSQLWWCESLAQHNEQTITITDTHNTQTYTHIALWSGLFGSFLFCSIQFWLILVQHNCSIYTLIHPKCVFYLLLLTYFEMNIEQHTKREIGHNMKQWVYRTKKEKEWDLVHSLTHRTHTIQLCGAFLFFSSMIVNRGIKIPFNNKNV